MSGFHYNGAIVRIRVRNFMTYSETELLPGPNLNMILGPNGTGKSAMVCCIIIGLAGEVSLTGRGHSPADFVKKNTDFATTEIELFNDNGRNHIVERKITITDRSKGKLDHKSEWRINKVNCNKSEVQDLMKQLNIKVDNLCQFLPQDSVTQFVKMNTVELLTDTLKAAGDNQLVEDHQKLVTHTRELSEATSMLNTLKQDHKEHQTNAARLETEVQQFEQRAELQKKRIICGQKIYYARYLDSKKKYESNKSEGRKLNEQFKNHQNDCEPHKKAKEHYSVEETKLVKSIQKSEMQVKTATTLIQNFHNSYCALKLDYAKESERFRSAEQEQKERESNIRLKQQELESLKDKLAQARDIDCTNQIKSLKQQLETIKRKMEQDKSHQQNVDDKHYSIVKNLEDIRRQYDNIKSINERKIMHLRAKYPDAYTVVEWLGRNKNRFSGTVHTPLMCVINVKDPSFSAVVEHAISRQDFQAFVCEQREDVTTLSRVAREELRVKINIIMAPDKSREREIANQTSPITPELSSLGIKCFLKDLIDAPDAVTKYLCASNNFHRIPVGVNCSEVQIKKLMDMFPRFYNDRSSFNVSRSRYDHQQMIVRDTAREAQHLKFSLDSERLESCKATMNKYLEEKTKLVQERSELQEDYEKGKREYHEVSSRHMALQAKQDEKAALERMINRNLEAIERLKAEKIDLGVERTKLNAAISRINSQIVTKIKDLSETCDNFVQIRHNYMKTTISKELVTQNRRFADKKLRNLEAESKTLMEKIERYHREIQNLKSDVESQKEIAEAKISGFRNGKLDQQTQTKFDTIPQDDVESLKSIRNDLHAQIERIAPDTGDIMEEFKKQKNQIKDKATQIAQLDAAIQKLEKDRDRIKVEWRKKLDEVIEVIDQNYRNFMKKLNYGGMVKLDYKPEDVNDFGAYGISIMVRYRDDEDLIPLTSTRQSGGERSVATMIYMLALQTKTTVPFRCVDEINQGMDKDNERKVFELLVNTADSSSSQYFLVSPKLLTNLDYSEKMRIHIVFNGKRLKLAWNRDVIGQTENDDNDDHRSSSIRRSHSNGHIIKKARRSKV